MALRADDGSSDIFIVRHGERLDYVDRAWARQAKHLDNPPLAGKGHKQASELAARFKSSFPHVRHIFSSPFVRCVHTANFIAEALNISIKIEPGICEVLNDFPPGFDSPEELHNAFPRVDLTYIPVVLPSQLRSEYGDGDCISRSAKCTKQVWQRFENQGPLLFVGHGASCAGIGRAFSGSVSYQGLCTLTHLKREMSGPRGGWCFALDGDTSHLSDKSNLRAY